MLHNGCIANQTLESLKSIISVSSFYMFVQTQLFYRSMDLKSDWIFGKTIQLPRGWLSPFFLFFFLLIFKKSENQKNTHFPKKNIKKKLRWNSKIGERGALATILKKFCWSFYVLTRSDNKVGFAQMWTLVLGQRTEFRGGHSPPRER